MSFHLTLFGAPTVALGGRCLALPAERRSQLVAYLALRRVWVARTEVAALLWPDADGHYAAVNLRKALHRMAQASWAPALEQHQGSLRLVVDTDVAAFEAALAAGRADEAIALRQGELLQGFDDDANPAWSAWLQAERSRLRAAWREVVLGRLRGDVDVGTTIELSTRLLAADALDEAALTAQLGALVRSGQTARAHQVYREFCDRLRSELGVGPGAALRAQHEAIADAAPRVGVPVAGGALAGDGFIGRDAERGQLAELIGRDDCRLVCLMGPGGVGKTRLARRVLAELAPAFTDGAALIPLQDLASGADIGARLARELGVPLSGNRDALDQVSAALAQRRMLLALDNIEQLAGGAAVVERLLQACQGLKLIVTSRVRLGLAAEWLFTLDGLPCPEPEDADRIEAFDAARLFIDAARRVEPGLSAATEAAAIVDICRLVDGLPLALELAAGWTRLLPCAAIADEIRNGAGLLRAVDPALPERHASIDRVFEPSWRLLSDAERAALARLSVFRGGCTPEAARDVAGAPWTVLAALADKSLLRKDGARLSLHPLLQQLVAQRLGDGAERQAAEAAHADHFHRLLVQQRRAVANGDRDALRRLDLEFENCRAAWRWAVAQGRSDMLADGAPALTQFTDHQCRHAEGHALLLQALDSAAVAANPRVEAWLLGHLALLEARMDRYPQAEAIAERALELAQRLQQLDAELQCLRVLGTCAMRRGRYDDARAHFGRSLQLAPAEVDAQNAADMLHNLAVLAAESGQPAETLRLAGQSVALHHRIGDHAGEASGLQVLAIAHMRAGEHELSAQRLQSALALSERHGLVTLRASVLGAMVDLARLRGDFDAAARHARQAIEIAAAANYRALMAGLQFDLVHIALHRGDLDAARSALGAGMRIAVDIGRPTLQTAGVAWFAQILAAAGEPEAACAAIALAIAHPLATAADRQAYLAHQQRWGHAGQAAAAIGFDALARRLADQAGSPVVPLVALLDDSGAGAPAPV